MNGSSIAAERSEPVTRSPVFWTLVAACFAAFVWLNLPTLLTLHSQWLNSYYSHGYPLAALVCYLLFREVMRGSLLPLTPSGWGTTAFVLATLATYLGRAAGIVIVAQMMLPVMILSAVWAVSGLKAVRAFWPSVAFLYFAIPFWEDLAAANVPLVPLNDGLLALSTLVVSNVVRATGIPAFIQGNLINIPAGTFEIAEGCSGRVYFIAGIELALFYGLLYLRSWHSRWLLVAAAAGLALVGNWIRIYALILIGHFSAMQSRLVEDHSDFGWVVFMLVIAPMVLLGRRLEDAEGLSPPVARSNGVGGHAVTVMTTVLAVLLSVTMLGYFLEPRGGAVAPIAAPVVNGWQHTGSWLGAGRPLFRGAGEELAISYVDSTTRSERIDVYIASYSAQRQGSEIVHVDNHPEGAGASLFDRRSVTIEDAVGASRTFAELEVGSGSARRLVWYAARVAGRETADAVVAKVFQVVGALLGRHDAQVLVLSTECEVSCELARSLLAAYAAQAAGSLFSAAEDAALANRASREP